MGDDNGLRVIKGGADAVVTEEELIKAENDLRKRAKEIHSDIDRHYWELGECLYSIYDGVPGGYRDLLKGDGSRQRRQELFRKWGYDSFSDYVERELGIRRRSAENLRYAYYYFEIALKLPKEVKDQILAIGRSKVYILAGIAKEDDILTWLDKARRMTFESLRNEIKSLRQSNTDSTLEGDYSVDEITGVKETSAKSSLENDGPPPPEKMYPFQTSFHPEQQQTWEAVFDRTKNITKSNKINHNLELVMQDYLANGGEFLKSEDDLKAHLQKQERLTGLALIGIDLKSGKAVHNSDLLWRLIQEAVEEDRQGREPKVAAESK